ncbi:aldehyde dehydrogenase family protein [Patescibacteria group bacterium]
MNVQDVLRALGITDVSLGTSANGDWYPQDPGDVLESRNPFSGDLIAGVRQTTPDGYEYVMSAASGGSAKWQAMTAPMRGDIVRELGNRLRALKGPLGLLISMEMGKILAEGEGEVQEMIDICDYAVGLSRMLPGLTIPSERPEHFMCEQWHPLGTIGIVTAFNFPAAVWAWNAAIAAVCGSTMVWKPSSKTPLTAIAIQKICNDIMQEHGLPSVFNLVIGSGQVIGDSMINDTRMPLISFTGSTKTGIRVAQAVAGRLGDHILELGGNNAVIVTPHADLEMATRAILFGAVGTAGQRCTSTRRVIVQESVADELIRRLTSAYGQVCIGDPTDPKTLMGPLVSSDAVCDMFAAIECAKGQGGEIVYGGRRLTEIGAFCVEPTIIRMPSQTAVVKQETFAPVLYVLTYGDLDEAITIHNDVPQGLSSSMFTTDLREAMRFISASGSDCGIANINTGTSGAEIGGAFGGNKATGGGRESGSNAWQRYMRRATNVINFSGQLPLAQGIEFGTN